jgi:hypothetical protein
LSDCRRERRGGEAIARVNRPYENEQREMVKPHDLFYGMCFLLAAYANHLLAKKSTDPELSVLLGIEAAAATLRFNQRVLGW